MYYADYINSDDLLKKELQSFLVYELTQGIEWYRIN